MGHDRHVDNLTIVAKITINLSLRHERIYLSGKKMSSSISTKYTAKIEVERDSEEFLKSNIIVKNGDPQNEKVSVVE